MTVRLARDADAAGVAAVYAPYVTDTAISFEEAPPDGAEMARRIGATLPRWPWLVAEDAAGIAGYAYGGAHRARAAYGWAAEVSVYVAPRAHRRGVARALYGALLDLLRGQGYAVALAGIALPNAASVGFHEAVGFRPVGVYPDIGFKHGAWHSVGWWTLRLSDAADPLPPRPLDADAAEVVGRLAQAAREGAARAAG